MKSESFCFLYYEHAEIIVIPFFIKKNVCWVPLEEFINKKKGKTTMKNTKIKSFGRTALLMNSLPSLSYIYILLSIPLCTLVSIPLYILLSIPLCILLSFPLYILLSIPLYTLLSFPLCILLSLTTPRSLSTLFLLLLHLHFPSCFLITLSGILFSSTATALYGPHRLWMTWHCHEIIFFKPQNVKSGL